MLISSSKTIFYKELKNIKQTLISNGLSNYIVDEQIKRIGFTRQYFKMAVILFTNPSARAGYDTKSIFKRSLTGLNSEFSFS